MALWRTGRHSGDQEHLRRWRAQQRDASGAFPRFSPVPSPADSVQINNSAPSHETLGTLNGIAQTLSAAGRSFGPFLSGGLFTLSMRIRPKGEALAWGLFAGVALIGWVGTLLIRGKGLESADWMGNDSEESEVASDEEEGAISVGSPV